MFVAAYYPPCNEHGSGPSSIVEEHGLSTGQARPLPRFVGERVVPFTACLELLSDVIVV